jgi:hypothetical protein
MVRERLERSGWEPVPDRWAQRYGGSIDVWPGQWWSVYRTQPAEAYPSCDFEVMLTGLTPEDEHSEPTFNAGLVWRSHRELANPVGDSDWVRELLGTKPDDNVAFEIAAAQGKVRRSRLIADVPGVTLAHQADAMAEFANTTFAALRSHPPA